MDGRNSQRVNGWDMTEGTQSTTSQGSQISSDEHRQLWADWMARLTAKLYLARTIKIDPDRRAFFLEEVIAANMTREQAVIAWHWIIYGDWTYKGTNPTLELADFYPSERQVEQVTAQLKDKGFVVMTRADFERECKIHYNAGHADGYAKGCTDAADRSEVRGALNGCLKNSFT